MRTNLDAVKASFEYLVSGAGDGYFKANPAVRDLIGTDNAWLGAHRGVVTQGIGNALFEACDTAGLERVALPAEFMAAGIVLMVRPVNWLLACHWVGALHSQAALANAEEANFDPVAPQQLFALCCSVGSYFKSGGFEGRWRSRFESRIDEVSEKSVSKKKKV